MSDTGTEIGDVIDMLDDFDSQPARKGRPLPANIIRRPVEPPPMERVKADA